MTNRISSIILGSALAIGLTLPLGRATFGERDWGGDCHRRLEADRARVDRDVARYGEHSRKVDRDVARLDDDRRWCRNHRADWDHSRFDVGIYFRH
jgi:hypothetical protein